MRLASIAVFTTLLFFSGTVIAQPRYWQQELAYDIDVNLDDVNHSLDGALKLNYKNNSPDTLYFIWFHIWPNAFKNDRTAFSEERLRLGKTDFYFAKDADRGYINRLDFRVGDISLETEDHPQYIDVIKVILTAPLPPGKSVQITTPFHVQMPLNYSGFGHDGTDGQRYHLTNWYPKAAVYDREGWHPMPYQEHGGFYDETGSFDLRLTLPANYLVAASGELKDKAEADWMATRINLPERAVIKKPKNKNSFKKPSVQLEQIQSAADTKTISYHADAVQNFALYADKYMMVRSKDLQLGNGKSIRANIFSSIDPGNGGDAKLFDGLKKVLDNSIQQYGDYPYSWLTLVLSKNPASQGNARPGLLVLNNYTKESWYDHDSLLHSELGAAWLNGSVAVNAGHHLWLVRGLGTYQDIRYWYGTNLPSSPKTQSRLRSIRKNLDIRYHLLDKRAIEKKDQPVATPAEKLADENYELMSTQKPAEWFRLVETRMGTEAFDKAIRDFVQKNKFRHAGPYELKETLNAYSAKNIDTLFEMLETPGRDWQLQKMRGLTVGFFTGVAPPAGIRRMYLLPLLGYNKYDGLMAGLAIHNYGLPVSRFNYFVLPMVSRNLVAGIADLGYSVFPGTTVQQIRFGAGVSRFASLSGIDSNGKKIYGGFLKLTPSVKVHFRKNSLQSTTEKYVEWKTFIIGENGFSYKEKLSDGVFYPEKTGIVYRYLNQLTFNIENNRVLYPYRASLQAQQGRDFYRINFDAGYFFNYPGGGGMNIRVFAARFGYIGSQSIAKRFATQLYQPKLTAVRGNEDYTYSNYFAGRNESDGFFSQQIMMRDGGLKIRTDLFQDLQGRSDNWVSSINLSTSIPASILPPQVPLRLFADIGTYAGAWDKEATGSRFLYVAGVQLSLFKNVLNIYAPVVYSKQFSDNLKTVPEENKFLRKISFSIDIHRVNLRKFVPKQIIW